MKTQIFLLVLVAVFSLVGNSYGQGGTFPQEDPSLYDVSLLLQLRNSDGQLITYIEPTTMYISNIELVHEFLDTKENKKLIEKDGVILESIQYEHTFRFSETKQISTIGMSYKNDFVLSFRHDGILTAPGDTLDASWKIVRTIQ